MLDILFRDHMLYSYLAVYARWIVGAVLLAAGVAKLHDLDSFASTIELFRLIPRQLSTPASHLIVGLELFIGLSLIVGVGVDLAAPGAAGLFGIFALAVGVNLIRHNLLACNCFGPYFREQISEKTLIRSMGFIALCILIVKFYDGYLAADSLLTSNKLASDGSWELFFLLTAALIITGLTVLSAKAVLKNFTSSENKNA